MKKLLLIAALLVSSLAADIAWMKYSDAMQMAKKEKKIVMVMLSQEGCGACYFMKEQVFKDAKVSSEFANGFLGVYIDIHDDLVPSGLDYIGTPTFHFLNADGIKIDRIDGGKKAEKFIEKLQEVRAK